MDANKEAINPLFKRLLAEHGEILNARALVKLLKFSSDRSFRRAAANGALPIRVFKMAGRKGWFAKTEDASIWLEKAGGAAFEPDQNVSQEVPMT